jgi:hypothetical protein
VEDGAGDPGARLWLRALEALAERVAHELRNPLNGAVLNAEVLRGRAGRPGVTGAALAPFAEAAASELARAAALSEALLALARPLRTPVDLSAVLPPLLVLADAVARAQGGTVTAETVPVLFPSSLGGHVVRGAFGAALVASLDAGPNVRCTIGLADGRVAARFTTEGRGTALDADARNVLHDAGIGLDEEPDGFTLLFPS